MKMNVGFRLKAGRDDLIIKWLESIGEYDRSYYIREALRSYLLSEGSKNMVSNNGSTLQVEKDHKAGTAEVITENKGDADQEKIAELEVNLNNWIDTV